MAELGNAWKSERNILDEKKELKRQELSSDCQEDILSGFEVEIDNKVYHFSYDREAQVNLQERWQIFQNNMVEEMSITAHLGKEDVRLTVNKDVFGKIYMQSVMVKENKIKKLREDLFPLVDMAQSEEDLKTITWDMDVIVGGTPSIEIKDDKLLDKEIKRIELETALSSSEMMNLIFTGQLGDML